MTETHSPAPAVAGLRVISPEQWGADLGLVQGGTFREMVGPASGAQRRSMHHVRIDPAGTTVPLRHDGEAVYYVVEGTPVVTELLRHRRDSHRLAPGSMIHLHAGATYAIESDQGAVLIGGPCPVDPALGAAAAPYLEESRLSVYHRDRPGLMVPFISRDARLVVWLGAGAVDANMNYVVLEPGERNKEHVHAESEDTIHILEGRGTAENVSTGERFPIGPGDTVHIEIGTWHAVAADRGERVVSVGGPCPADTDMLRAAGVDVADIMEKIGR
ncbi:cupin domain-containing protein [Nocardioides sp. L-11A]|uniref:cupin domain-containing protein n=1 Tax=Nocardioides sp. L-11A TaxID=3043848 RepID=UPI00249CD5AC|nr:cupin domain-containing protein [Nocardioides sp. L-11A]